MNMVNHNGGAVLIYPEVLEELGLQQGQFIDTDTFWKVIALNASVMIAKIAVLKDKENKIMTPQQTDWIEYTGSDEQIAELRDAPRGWIVRFDSGIESNIFVSHPQLHVELSSITYYWIIPADPLREMKIRQAQTGQPVWIRVSFVYKTWRDNEPVDYVTTNPDWNIPNAEYSFTPFED